MNGITISETASLMVARYEAYFTDELDGASDGKDCDTGRGETKQAAINNLVEIRMQERLPDILRLDGFGTSREELVLIIKYLLGMLDYADQQLKDVIATFVKLRR